MDNIFCGTTILGNITYEVYREAGRPFLVWANNINTPGNQIQNGNYTAESDDDAIQAAREMIMNNRI
jgi:hypothetical protein